MKTRLFSKTKVVKYEDAEFTIRLIPASVWIELDAEVKYNFKALRSPLLEKLLASGKPREEWSKDDWAQIFIEKNDPRVNPDLLNASKGASRSNLNVVKHGITAHNNLVDESGAQVPCKMKEGILDDETLNFYLVNGLIPFLAAQVTMFQTITDDERKNS